MINNIVVKGARTHNLKNISVSIPKNKLVVITGVSGSGKSTLAFDTLYAEGQRRYVESLSSYARQFLELMEKPDVDSIDYLSPAISIEQKSISKNPRSTVGTITEIYDYMRLLFARVGDVYCPKCHRKIESFSIQKIVDSIKEFPENEKIEILSPVIRGKKGEHKILIEKLLKEGYVRAYIDKEIIRLEDDIQIDKKKKHSISVIIDRLVLKEGIDRRLTDSIEVATKLSEGLIECKINKETHLFSENFACTHCNISFSEVEPRIFSFNNPYGACPECNGLGEKLVFDYESIAPDPEKSIREGAIKPWEKFNNYYFYSTLMSLSDKYNIDLHKPFKKLTEKEKDIIFNGIEEPLRLFTFKEDKKIFYEKKFQGVIGYLKDKFYSSNKNDTEFAKSFMSHLPCPQCEGNRLKNESLAVSINKKNISETARLNANEALSFFNNLHFRGFKEEVAKKIIKEIIKRLTFLKDVGLDYISLDRKASTLSGGEAQRIRLASMIGSGLTGVLYVLDEPSIGLHQKDNNMLIETLKKLRDIGNSVVVVEHDEDTILQSDFIIDMGPGAGRKGGNVVYAGIPEKIMQHKGSITGDYLSGIRRIRYPQTRKKPDKKYIEIKGAREHNLKNINVAFPLAMMVCVTGVSGSGKSTLVMDILYNSLKKKIYGSNRKSGEHDAIVGYKHIDKVIDVDQSPIGRTPRSNPATYTGIFTDIRDLFSRTQEAKIRGYKPGRFSFNLKGGRCENCQGEGYLKIEMHFLPDMYVKCDVCKGGRYNRDTLDIAYKGVNIAKILSMTVNQSAEFFGNIPKIVSKLDILKDVGLGYIGLGQAATTLSGGEAQRIKLAKELMKKDTGKTLYIFDEPTTGLHFDDIDKLIKIFMKIVNANNSIIIIEHNMDIIKCADHIIDLGPGGGIKGGEIIFEGSPEECIKNPKSDTGHYLKHKLLNEKTA